MTVIFFGRNDTFILELRVPFKHFEGDEHRWRENFTSTLELEENFHGPRHRRRCQTN